MTCNKLNFNLATIAIVLVLFSFAIVSTAQSVGTVAIFLKSGEVRFGTIQEAADNNTIRLINDCGIYNIPRTEIDSIKDQQTVLARENVVPAPAYQVHSQITDNNKITIREKGFYNITSVALLFGQGQNGFLPIPSLSTVNGWQFNKHLFTGLGVAYEYYEWSVLPVFADVKYMLKSEGIIPFASMKMGYAFTLSKPDTYDNAQTEEYRGGFQVNPEIGIRIPLSSRSSFLMSLGYHFQQLSHKENRYYWWENSGNYETIVHTDYNRISLRAGFMF